MLDRSGSMLLRRRLALVLPAVITGTLMLLARAGLAEAPATLAWSARYDGPTSQSDSPASMALDAGGNVYVAGSSDGSGTNTDFVVLKYSSAGTQLWARRYDGPASSSDSANSVAVDSTGNVYVAGESYDGAFDYALVKYDANGNEVWVRRYERTGIFNGGVSRASLVVDSGGNIYLAGSDFRNGDFDYLVAKYSPAGDVLWTRFYNGPADTSDVVAAATLDSGGNVTVTGESVGSDGTLDYATVSYTPAGLVRWTQPYNGGGIFDRARAIATDALGNSYVTGSSPHVSGSYDFATVSYSPTGAERWLRRYSGNSNYNGGAGSLAVSASGRLYVGGYISDGSSNIGKLLCYGLDGTEIWERSPAAAFDVTVATDGSGAAYASGPALYDSGFSLFEVALAKYLPDGTQAWETRWRSATPGFYSDERPGFLALGGTGSIYVTGGSWLSSSLAPPPGRFSSYDIATLKFTQAAPDTTPPVCIVGSPVTETSPTRVYLPVQISDAGSGVARVELTARSSNCTLQSPLGMLAPTPPVPGGVPTINLNPAPSMLTVYAVKINASASARVELRVTDAAGNSMICDPVVATLEIPKGKRSITRTFKGLPAAEHYLGLENGTPGLRQVSIVVNGRNAGRARLSNGEVQRADLERYYRSEDRNTVQITASGAPGSRAMLLIGDASLVGGGMAAAYIPLVREVTPHLNLDWCW